MKLFAGTANPSLAQELSSLISLPLSKAEIIRFDNSEVKVTILEDVANEDCYVVQSTSNPTDTHIMELLFFIDALKRQEARKVTAIIPYFGYARQNAQHRKGESVSMNVVVKMLETVGADEVIVFNLHEEASAGMFSIPFTNDSALAALVPQVKEYILSVIGSTAIEEGVAFVTPDQEGVERARLFAEAVFPGHSVEVAVTEKKRNLDIKHESEAMALYGNVENKVCVIVDDIITSGGTVIHSADLCLQKGAKRVICCIAHADLATDAGNKLQNSQIDRFFATNTVELQPELRFPKLTIVSVADLLKQYVK